MAPSLYGQFNSPLATATSPYAQAAVQQTDQAIKPQVDAALKGADQTASNRGILTSGINVENHNGITNDYLNTLAGTATQAAMQGAQQNYQTDAANAQREFEQKMQDQQLAQQKGEFDTTMDNQKQAMWANLISGAAKSAGSLIGGVIPPVPAAKSDTQEGG